MDLSITHATERDVPALADLLDEMERFYGVAASAPAGTRHDRITEMIFGDAPAARVLLARDPADDPGRAAGFAAYTFHWPAVRSSRSLFLKELYVAGAHRGRGIGRRLMRQLFDVAAETGCSRVEWTADRENAGARRFYERLGFRVHEDKLFYRAGADTRP